MCKCLATESTCREKNWFSTRILLKDQVFLSSARRRLAAADLRPFTTAFGQREVPHPSLSPPPPPKGQMTNDWLISEYKGLFASIQDNVEAIPVSKHLVRSAGALFNSLCLILLPSLLTGVPRVSLLNLMCANLHL